MSKRATKADLKILIIGNSATGKTSFSKMWIKGEYLAQYKVTIMTEYSYKIYEYKGNKYKIQIWDLCGQDKNIKVTNTLTKNSNGCIVFTDITDKKSFNE
jgi:small GTP-binding protein